MSFITSEWRKLVLVNYTVDPALLKNYLPYGTEMDLWEGKCYLSLVGFMFLNTKVLGLKIPYHTNFEEVNLRFYVKRKVRGEWRRGVVFIKEIVPKRTITYIANHLYNENYETLPMKHHWKEKAHSRVIEYAWEKNSKWQFVRLIAELNSSEIEPGCETEFITEHYWGYAKVNDKKTNEYEVTHPRWMKYEVLDHLVDVDFGLTYGNSFNMLNTMDPTSVMLAEGSTITVESKRVLK